MAAARYTWMFRAAAIVSLLFGCMWLYTFTATSYHPEQRPYGLAAGALALVIGIFLVRRARFAIALSALAAALVCVSAAVFAPVVRGPGILFLGLLAILCGVYVVLSLRVLFTRNPPA